MTKFDKMTNFVPCRKQNIVAKVINASYKQIAFPNNDFKSLPIRVAKTWISLERVEQFY